MEILFLDLDGTTLNDQKEITAGNRAAIQTALASGCRVVVTSGRPLSSALRQARRLELAGPDCADSFMTAAGNGSFSVRRWSRTRSSPSSTRPTDRVSTFRPMTSSLCWWNPAAMTRRSAIIAS